MIQAETITHEGDAVPNWLDQYRAALTPITATIGLGLIIVVVISLAAIIGQQHAKPPLAASSVQLSTSASLHVTPLSGIGQTAQNASSSQAAAQATTAPLQSPASSQQATNQSSAAASAPLSGLSGDLSSSATSSTATVQPTLQGSSSSAGNL